MKFFPIAGLVAVAALAACGSTATSNRPVYDGVPFKVKAKPIDKKTDPATFSIEIKNAGRSIKGAREAAAHGGTKYCVQNYGSSKIAWVADPMDEEAQLTLTDGRAIFQGTCNP
ncbi:hypothetical protein RA19_13150 [Leisingera sp. ANG-M1]|uniref:hypothetical protein n=1 Tax=Leisingera sp. ANG-M1 TaxID=1577895 RepID=UPI00057ED51D|nr:hypothetical protein [Leisingera sp. ANG-M1]KIC10090.1 hypothetical protein RA19_13150 [Leisingera sp. ANG-M1]